MTFHISSGITTDRLLAGDLQLRPLVPMNYWVDSLKRIHMFSLNLVHQVAEELTLELPNMCNDSGPATPLMHSTDCIFSADFQLSCHLRFSAVILGPLPVI